jgi:hypothetical protein
MRPPAALRPLAAAALAALAAACTNLGPTPATTGLSARPMPRSGAEIQAGILPGHYLSESVVESPNPAGLPQLSGVIQADELGLPGVVAGARVFGEGGDSPIEPVLGYRSTLGADQAIALAGHVYGTRAAADENGASYEATRLGGELTGDIRVFAPSRWFQPHFFGSFNVTHISAEGTYCTDPERRWGEDCAEPGDPPKPMLTASVNGTFAAGSVGVAGEILRNRDSWFHGARIAFSVAGGVMPHIESGEANGTTPYVAYGLSLAVGVGAPTADRP